MIVTDKLSTESFHAFIDEQLTDEQYAQVEAQLDDIPEKIEEIQQCHIINERLREVFDPIVEEPLPEDLYQLALYGLEEESVMPEEAQVDEPISYLELEEDLAAIDSMDEFPEDIGGESLVDDNDVTDLEVLAQTEHLSEFDIDSLRGDSSNIIPDIFDDTDSDSTASEEIETPEGIEASEGIDPADDLLESIDELSVELEKAHDKKKAEAEPITLQAEPDFSEEIVEQHVEILDEMPLELEPLEVAEHADDEMEMAAEIPEVETQSDEPIFEEQQRVLETLTSEEELSLEPLDERTDGAFIQETEVPELDDVSLDSQKKSSRPRNLRASQSQRNDSMQVESPDAGVSQNDLFESMTETHSAQTPSSPEATGGDFAFSDEDNVQSHQVNKPKGPVADEAIPDDLVAEFFAENKRSDFEVNEVVKQFEEVSQDFDAAAEDHLFDEGPLGEFRYRFQQFIDSGRSRVNQAMQAVNEKKSQLLGKFGGGRLATDFNKSPFEDSDFLQTAPQQAPADTLDLSAFEDFANEPATQAEKPRTAKNFDVKKPASESFSIEPEQAGKSIQAENDVIALPADPPETPEIMPVTDYQTAPAMENEFDLQDMPPQNSPQAKQPARQDTGHQAAPEFDFDSNANINLDMDFGDDSSGGNLVSKFGDKLKYYKQKITEMRANQPEAPAVDEEYSSFEKYRNIVTGKLSNFAGIRDPRVMAGAALVTGVAVVALLVSLVGGTGDDISSKRIEKLAIDTHLLNTQFNAKLVADADAAIIEKLQWFSARVGRQVRLGDIRVEDFEFKKVTVIPTMANFAAANIFENKSGQRITLLAIPDIDSTPQAALSCRIPAEVDGLCVWVKDSVRYLAVANLSLSRVRSFSEQIIEKL